MKNIIAYAVGLLIVTLAIVGITIQYNRNELDAMEDRVSALEVERENLKQEVSSVTDALSVCQEENASLTDAYNELQTTIVVYTETEEDTEEETTTEELTTESATESKDTSKEESVETMVFATEDNDKLGGVIKDGGKYDVYVEEEEESTTEEQSSDRTYLGVYELTAYEWTGNPCANGNYPTCGYTVACNSLPLGTRIYIEGYGDFVVEDRGGMSGGVIDIYMGDVSTCLQFGRRTASVYVYN